MINKNKKLLTKTKARYQKAQKATNYMPNNTELKRILGINPKKKK
tara:strand:+ start:350 stop:484 length:135 start_codon:yes stop_codon:yes gene_type:complete